MPRGRKPGTFIRLQPEEVPEEFRDLFLYDTQRSEPADQAGKRTRILIDRLCFDCKRTTQSFAADVRRGIRNNTWTGRCHQCALRYRSGENNPGWKGGRRVDGNGYVQIYRPDHPASYQNGYILEHRLVMETKLGRYLTKDETVHHKDGNRANNHPDNLELWTGNHGKGIRAADLAKGLFMAQYYTALATLW